MIFKKIQDKNITKKQKGFTLLFAVLVSTLVLSVGASIISIALRQLILSSTGRDSQYAFYAANTGIECAYYWDIKREGGFARSASGGDVSSREFNIEEMSCLELDIGNYILGGGTPDFSGDDDFYGFNATAGETNFRIRFDTIGPESVPVPYCADVTVTKTIEGVGPDRRTATKIFSRGYNTCDENNPRRIERALEKNY